MFNTYENINYFVNRVKPYNPAGRNQTKEESDALVEPIKDLLRRCKIDYTEINGDEDGYRRVIDDLVSYLEVKAILDKGATEEE